MKIKNIQINCSEQFDKKDHPYQLMLLYTTDTDERRYVSFLLEKEKLSTEYLVFMFAALGSALEKDV